MDASVALTSQRRFLLPTTGATRARPTGSRVRRWVAACVALSLAAAGCGGSSEPEENPTWLRLGYFANVTHAPAIVGLDQGLFAEELGGIEVWTATFDAGNEAMTALFSGAVDMTFIGPNPAINGFAQSEGRALRIVAGSTSGGASFVVRPGIETLDDLRGGTFATPALGNTQDVALRAWLLDNGIEADLEGGGDVSIVPQANAQILESFRTGRIDGAWVPEPWASRLVIEGGGVVFLDEDDLWADGDFVTTHLIVSTEFLDRHPDLVEAVLRALVRTIDLIDDRPDEARRIVNDGIESITGARLDSATLERAWGQLRFTVDPIAESLRESASDAARVGLLQPVDLEGIYRLDLLDRVLAEMGREAVER